MPRGQRRSDARRIDAADMVERWKALETLPSIADRYCTTKQNVWRIIRSIITDGDVQARRRRRHQTAEQNRAEYVLEWRRRRSEKPCDVCGKPTTRPRYCSPEHARRARRKYLQDYYARRKA